VTSNQRRARYWRRWAGDSQAHNSASARSLARRRRTPAAQARRSWTARQGTSTTAAANPTTHQLAAVMAVATR
jgi:hypothetical protein